MEVDEPGSAAAPDSFNPLDLLPREGISGRITPGLIRDIGSDKWKERQAGMAAVEDILASTGHRIGPSLGGELVPALKPRMADTNRNLTVQASRIGRAGSGWP